MIWILSKRDESEYENSRLVEEFKAQNVEVKIVSPKHFDLIVDTNSRVLYNGSPAIPDLILVRTGSGTDFFTSCILKQYQHDNIKCINSPESIELAKDKLLTAQRLTADHLSTPKTILVRFPVDKVLIEKEIGFPCIVKPTTGSYGDGVQLCKNSEELDICIDSMASSKKAFLVQEYVGFKKGTDIRVIVIGGKVIGAMQRINENDFRANISIGGHGITYYVDDELAELAIKASKTVGLVIAGVDILFTHDGYSVLEINSAPGFFGFTTYTGVNIAKHIVDYVISQINYR
jgi:RimK family alpha-L-glutamate ligase